MTTRQGFFQIPIYIPAKLLQVTGCHILAHRNTTHTQGRRRQVSKDPRLGPTAFFAQSIFCSVVGICRSRGQVLDILTDLRGYDKDRLACRVLKLISAYPGLWRTTSCRWSRQVFKKLPILSAMSTRRYRGLLRTLRTHCWRHVRTNLVISGTNAIAYQSTPHR